MERVSFITTESGDDLIVSFAVMVPTDFAEIESLTLLWTPKYDHLWPPEERGVSASFERFMDDERELVTEVRGFRGRADRVGRDAAANLRARCAQGRSGRNGRHAQDLRRDEPPGRAPLRAPLTRLARGSL
jgi:hypothetical protein